ncbi:hypothetical protein [Micromonospora sp. 067-2]|uniref:hypothetical protein n=1 Tax=Micromonospora sp. 067-2 TaxID=2789270 RepID=UPI00397A2F74
MTDLDQRIVHTLRERAEGAVDTDRLMAGAVNRGRARVRRRRATAGAALSVVALLGVGVAVGSVHLGGSEQDGVVPADQAAGVVVRAVPPRADGVPGAAARPDLVGADAGVLHFGFAPSGPRYLNWSVQDGVERAELDVGGRTITLELAASADALHRSAQGVTGMVPESLRNGAFDGSVTRDEGLNGVPIWLRRWQPVPGVYARASVLAKEQRDLFDVAAALRLNEAYQCGGPLRLSALPAGARITGCEVSTERLPTEVTVVLTVARTTVPGLQVELGYAAVTESRTKGNWTIDGIPAYRQPQGGYLELLGFPKAHLTANFGSPYQGFTEADAAAVLGAAQVAEHLDQPATW